jgi:hypothetical protein
MIWRTYSSYPRFGFRPGGVFRPRGIGWRGGFGGPRRFGFVGARPWRWGAGGYRPWYRGAGLGARFAPWARRPYWGGGYRPWYRGGQSPFWRNRFWGRRWAPGFPQLAPWVTGRAFGGFPPVYRQPPSGWSWRLVPASYVSPPPPPVEAAPPPPPPEAPAVEAPPPAPPPEAAAAPPPEAPAAPDASAAAPDAAGAAPDGGGAAGGAAPEGGAPEGGAPSAGELPQSVSDGGKRVRIHWDEGPRELGEVAPPGGGVYVVFRDGRPETAHITNDFRGDVARRYGTGEGGPHAGKREHIAESEGEGESEFWRWRRRRWGRGRRSFWFGRMGRFGRGRWNRIRMLRAMRRQMAMNQQDDQGDDSDQGSDGGDDQG